MDEIIVSSNWKCSDDDSLKKIITCCSSEDIEYDIEQITTESCKCLIKPENDESESSPTVEIKSDNLIKKIYILSEGSLIEVFGNHNEYLFSCTSDFIDDWNGMAVYCAKIALPGIKNCTLKFTRVKEKNRLWIYVVQLCVIKSEESSNQKFNFGNVNKLLSNSNQQISEKAENFKRFFEVYVKNSSQMKNHNDQSFYSDNLLNLFTNHSFQFDELKKILNMSQMTNKLKGNVAGSSNETKLKNGEIELDNNSLNFDCASVEYLKNFIDERLTQMKAEILKLVEIKLEKYEKENSIKLDKIIQFINENSSKKIEL